MSSKALGDVCEGREDFNRDPASVNDMLIEPEFSAHELGGKGARTRGGGGEDEGEINQGGSDSD